MIIYFVLATRALCQTAMWIIIFEHTDRTSVTKKRYLICYFTLNEKAFLYFLASDLVYLAFIKDNSSKQEQFGLLTLKINSSSLYNVSQKAGDSLACWFPFCVQMILDIVSCWRCLHNGSRKESEIEPLQQVGVGEKCFNPDYSGNSYKPKLSHVLL